MFSLYNHLSERFLDSKPLSSVQKDAVTGLVNGKDVFLSSKTGSGKSLLFHCIPVLGLSGRRNAASGHAGGAALVVVPLVSIMEEQCFKLNELGFRALKLENKHCADIAELKFDYLFASPEEIVGNRKWRRLLSEKLQKHIRAICVDEAHTVVSWGQGDTPFRVWFDQIGELRSLLPSTQMVALTATASPTNRRKIMKSLSISTNPSATTIIVLSPDRHNITLFQKMHIATTPLEITFNFIIEGLLKNGTDFPKHVVFCKRIQDCANLFELFKSKGIPLQLFDMYHSKTRQHIQKRIRDDLSLVNGKIRVLIATNAAGMGVNFANLNICVHYGTPVSMDTFVQQMGRVGRDDQAATHIMLYNKRQRLNCDPEMAEYTNTEKCLRQYLLECYSAKKDENESSLVKHLCCQNCRLSCNCGSCPDLPIALQEDLDCEVDELIHHAVSSEQQDLLRELLVEYRDDLYKHVDIVSGDLLYGFPVQLIDQVVDNCGVINNVGDLLTHTDIVRKEHCSDVLRIVSTVFPDSPIEQDVPFWEDDDI